MKMEKTIVDFSSPAEQDRWEIINDAVMGGLSESRVSITDQKTALFAGVVSLENEGGFSSMRTYPGEFDLAGYKGLIVRVKGDGKNYRLRLRTDDAYEGVAYQAHFSTERDVWITARLPFEVFIPVFRGREVEDAPPLDLSGIQRIGFMIADKQAGPFRIEVEWVKAYA
jgi:NADH dehydrogenase [ubiquinone] 1 alpha subcomplex assembly factor 1